MISRTTPILLWQINRMYWMWAFRLAIHISYLRDTVHSGLISVTNNAFSFSKHHPLPLMAMKHLQQSYDPACWNCIGPKLITDCVQKISRTKLVEKIPKSVEINFTPLRRIMSVHWLKVAQTLFPEKPKTFEEWKRLFKYSSAVHFFSKTTSGLTVFDNPQYSAYALLGPRYCPIAYYSVNNFW